MFLGMSSLLYQGTMEDHYNSKQKELKNFKENLGAFCEDLVLECQNGPLFDKGLFEKFMDYVIAMSWYAHLWPINFVFFKFGFNSNDGKKNGFFLKQINFVCYDID